MVSSSISSCSMLKDMLHTATLSFVHRLGIVLTTSMTLQTIFKYFIIRAQLKHTCQSAKFEHTLQSISQLVFVAQVGLQLNAQLGQ
jgi:hypothetical protein